MLQFVYIGADNVPARPGQLFGSGKPPEACLPKRGIRASRLFREMGLRGWMPSDHWRGMWNSGLSFSVCQEVLPYHRS